MAQFLLALANRLCRESGVPHEDIMLRAGGVQVGEGRERVQPKVKRLETRRAKYQVQATYGNLRQVSWLDLDKGMRTQAWMEYRSLKGVRARRAALGSHAQVGLLAVAGVRLHLRCGA
jgi:hypothetical protein